jgi:ABC-type dipeptide/oligopeptide/nickel transport system permease component
MNAFVILLGALFGYCAAKKEVPIIDNIFSKLFTFMNKVPVTERAMAIIKTAREDNKE